MTAEAKIWQKRWPRLAVAGAVAVVIAWRKHDALAHPQFWAEDGSIYFLQAALHPARSIVTTYAGYFVLAPRLIATLGTFLPIFWIPAFYAWCSLALASLVAWLTLSPRIGLPVPWAAALAIALVPNTGEVYLNIANVQWILMVGLAVLSVTADPPPGPRRWGEALWLAVMGLTGPYVVLALPLFAWRLYRSRSRWSAVLFTLTLVCSAVQTIALLGNPLSPAHPVCTVGHEIATAGVRLFLLGLPYGRGWSDGICAGIAIAAVLLLGWGCLRRRLELPDAWLLLAVSVLILAASFYRCREMGWDLGLTLEGDRYFFAEKVLLVWLSAILAWSAGAVVRRLMLALALLALLINSPRFVFTPKPDLNWRHYSDLIQNGLPTTVPTLPVGWQLVYPGRQAGENPR